MDTRSDVPPPGRPDPQVRLAAALRASPDSLAFVGRLGADGVGRLERLVAEAVARDGAAIDRCMEDALHAMPRPLRRPVRRILGMDER